MEPRATPTPEPGAVRPLRDKYVEDQLQRPRGANARTDDARLADDLREQFGGGELDPDDWAPILAAHPEILLRFINSSSKNGVTGQRLANGPVLVTRRPRDAPRTPAGGRYAGSMLIQSLNPFGNDTIVLMASLGQFLRNAWVQGHADAPVLVTGPSWARRNKSVRNAALGPLEAERALGENLRGRQALCELAGLTAIVCNIADRPHYLRERTVSEQQLWEPAVRLKVLVRTFWPELYDKPLSEAERARVLHAPFGAWLTECPEHLRREQVEQVAVRLPTAEGSDLLALFPSLRDALPSALAPYLHALGNIALHQGWLSNDYFYYFWAQMHFQGPEFRDYLKIAPISERRFDDPMFEIRPDDCRMDALYLPHYMLGKSRLLPYSTEHIDLAGRPADEIAAMIVTLRECAQDGAAAKLHGLLLRTPPIEVSRLFVDVLCFYALGLRRHGVEVAGLDAQIAELDERLARSLDAAIAGGPAALREQALRWATHAFSPTRDDRDLPFYFWPFFRPRAKAADELLGRMAAVMVRVGALAANMTGL